MPSIFYEIFNNIIRLNAKTIKNFTKSLKELHKELAEKGDKDNLKVLRNRLSHLLESKSEKLDKKERKQLKPLYKILDEIDDQIEAEIQKEEKEKEGEIIDVVEKVDKRYRACENIDAEKRDHYISICAKKSDYEYERELIQLQLELVKLQRHIKKNGEKLLVIFEGRDAAGKGGTIKRFMEYLNPRGAKVVALEKPNDMEKSQWYFQRYVHYLPSAGQMTFFDRSWYNRGGVEPVMGFVTKDKYEQFMKDAPQFENMLVDSGIKVIKFYFSVTKDEQAKRFEERRTNPLKQYKLSPIDQESQKLWEKYTLAEYKNFTQTHTDHCPWIVINSDNKKKARINAIKYVLSQFDYEGRIPKKDLKYDKKLVLSGIDKCKILKTEVDIDDDLFE